MAKAKKKCRMYNIDYLKFGFVESVTDKRLPMCLICEKVFPNDAMKPGRMEDHLSKCDPAKKGENLKFFQALKTKLLRRPTVSNMFNSASCRSDDGVQASYEIALLIAKTGEAHTIGERLILPAASIILNRVAQKPAHDILKRIPLSNNSIQRRIDEMGDDVEYNLCMHLQETCFAVQLDESTLPNNDSLLLCYVRYVKEQEIHEELLFARILKTDTKGETVYNTFKEYLSDKGIPLSNIMSAAVDGAPSMVGRYRGFLGLLKKDLPSVVTIHCVIHRQHLVAKNLSNRLHDSLQLVIDAVNKIRSNALHTRLFKQLCDENDESFTRLLLHTEVRWLSKGLCLNRFLVLFDSVIEFLGPIAPTLKRDLISRKSDVSYLTDIFCKFNEVNLQLQGDQLNLIKAKSVIGAFSARITQLRQKIGRRDFSQFPHLSQTGCDDDELLGYVEHLSSLEKDFNARFQDILTMKIPDWVIDPFVESDESDFTLQEPLLAMRYDEELKVHFKKGYRNFWLRETVSESYPSLWDVAKKFLICFPSSYLVERGFSAVTRILTRPRNRLAITERGDLRLLLTKLEPNIKLIMSKHQAHPSH